MRSGSWVKSCFGSLALLLRYKDLVASLDNPKSDLIFSNPNGVRGRSPVLISSISSLSGIKSLNSIR